MKTFTDYVDEVPVQFIRFSLPEGHPWAGQAVRQVVLPPASILVLVLRGDRRIVPDGSVQLQAGDTLILSGTAAGAVEGVHLYEKTLDADSSWLDQPLCRIHTGDRLVILVRRGGQISIEIISRKRKTVQSFDCTVFLCFLRLIHRLCACALDPRCRHVPYQPSRRTA